MARRFHSPAANRDEFSVPLATSSTVPSGRTFPA